MAHANWNIRGKQFTRKGYVYPKFSSDYSLNRVMHFYAVAIPTALLVFPVACGAQKVTAVTFQTDEIPTNTSVARWNGQPIPDMESYSICMYLKTIRARDSYDTTVSYAVPENFNEIYLGFTFPSGTFEVWWDYDLVSRAHVPNGLQKWWRFCYLQDMKEKIFVLYWNDETYNDTILVPDKVRGGGIFILGQDQDDLNGGFSLSQSFGGIIADFHLYDRLVSQQEALDFVACKPRSLKGNPLIDFSDISNKWSLEGSVEANRVSLAEICDEKTSHLVMFPEPRLFLDSMALCESLDGNMYAPATPEENQGILPYVVPHISQCKDGNGNTIQLGVKGDPVTENYYYYNNGSLIVYHNLSSLNYIQGQDCMGYLMTVGSEGKWYQSRCELDQLCTLCYFGDITHVKVRGLCEDSLLDSTFLLRGTIDDKPEFQGYYYSMLRWSGDTWELHYLPDQNTNASMIATRPNQYPLGRHEWMVRGDLCSLESESRLPLVFTTCKVPGSYAPELPPQQPDRSAVVVGVKTNITAIRAFSLLELMIAFDMVVSFTWQDSRLTFSNLKDNMEMNLVGGDAKLWNPKVFYEEGSGSKVDTVERVSQTYIQRNAPPLADLLIRLKEDEQYKGSDNNLVELRTLTVKSNCLFDLSMYPFDVQICQLIIRSALGVRSVKLNTTGVNFVGERRLLEYSVEDLSAKNTESDGLSEIRVFIKFVNLYNYYISGTYVPTTLLLTITYLTFYFPLNDFTDRIMVSLTALLVLAALFLQTNQAMPRTAYLKLVDVWFVFCISVDFMIVLLLVIINYLHENLVTVVSPKGSNRSGILHNSSRKIPRIPSFLNTVSRITVPLGFLFFTIGYIIYAVSEWQGGSSTI